MPHLCLTTGFMGHDPGFVSHKRWLPGRDRLRDIVPSKGRLEAGAKSVQKRKELVAVAKDICIQNITGITVAPAFKDALKLKFRIAGSPGEAGSARRDLEDYSFTA